MTTQPMATSRTTSVHHVGVVDAVSSGQSRGHQRHHLVAGVGSAWGIGPGRGAGQPVRAGPDAGPAWLAGPAQHWPPGGGRQRRRECGRGGYLIASFRVLLAWGRFGVTKAIIPDGPEHFLSPSAHRDTHLFGGLGVNKIWQNVKGGESDHGRT